MPLRRIVVAAVVAGFVPAAPAGAAPPSGGPDATRLSISVSDSVAQVRDRASVAYVATVVNDGAAAVRGRLVLQVPAYAHYREAGRAKVTDQVATWTVRVPAHSTVSRRATVRIGTIPSGQLRVTSLASLFLGPLSGAPAVRAADTDRIAGVTDPPRPPAPTRTSHRRASAEARGDDTNVWLLAGVPLVGVAGLAGLVGLVRRRRRTAAASGGAAAG